jgi:hypothetical protein
MDMSYNEIVPVVFAVFFVTLSLLVFIVAVSPDVSFWLWKQRQRKNLPAATEEVAPSIERRNAA